MTPLRSTVRFLVAVAWLALALVPASRAQSLWSTPYVPNQITLEVLQPTLRAPAGEDVSVLTGAATLSGSYLITDRTTVVVGVPVAHYQSTLQGEPPEDFTETALGNPYVGVGISSTRVPLLAELGIRLPLTPHKMAATRAGRATDLPHREAFAPHVLSAQLMLNTRWDWTRTAGLRFRGGPLVTTPTQDASGSTELYTRYGLQGWYEGDRFIVGAGLMGRVLVTERGGAFSERTTHQASGTVILNLPRLQPGLLLRTPINGPGSENVDLVVGLTLSMTL